MAGIDRLISSSLSAEIKKRMDLDTLKKVERELFLDYGMSIKLSIEHFHKFINVFKKNSNLDIKKFEKNCINKIIKVKKRENNYVITIVYPELSHLILEYFGDPETRRIISVLLEKEYTIPQILKESKIPKTSGYRKVDNLIISGLLVESGKILSESKKIAKIQCVFQEIRLDIKKDKISVVGVVSSKMFEKSTSMKSILETFS